MKSWLKFCDGIIEAGWLAAVMVLPLFFNVLSSRIFEPDKIALLRSLALLLLGAWIVKLISQVPRTSEDVKNSEVLFRPTGGQTGKSRLRSSTLQAPLLLPALFTAFVYIIATFFSINPRVSFWGSYQRLQGVYTAFSYLVIFAVILFNLRRRAQVERLITVIIIASLPVALYGILQKYRLDPIPWGGNVTVRIASTLGNSIFVAAYLIMVFPLVLGRIVSAFRSIRSSNIAIDRHPDNPGSARTVFAPFFHILRASLYVFIAVLQVAALYLSGSRGPTLGWLASCFFILLMFSFWKRLKWMTLAMVGLVILLTALLLTFNLEGGPFEALRASPAIGRFGLLLDAESNSALVRRYIWEGAVDLLSPHRPLEFPDGSQDRFNILRPLLGFGPESMFVAYNPFYIPALGQVEKRNATPDRAHNETWDSLIITGLLGLVAYLWLFLSVFYYGLKWIGMIDSRLKQRLYLIFMIVGGAAGGILFVVWRGMAYVGVGIPFGILLGLIGFVVVASFLAPAQATEKSLSGSGFTAARPEAGRFLTLLMLLAAILAHFVEINFGIAIGVTRTYFWIYCSVLILVGFVFPQTNPDVVLGSPPGNAAGGAPTDNEILTGQPARKKKPRTDKNAAREGHGVDGLQQRWPWVFSALACGGILGMLLATLGFDFISNQNAAKSAIGVLWLALTRIIGGATSYAMMVFVAVTWLVGGIILSIEIFQPDDRARPDWSVHERDAQDSSFETQGHRDWLWILLTILVSSFVIGAVYWWLQSAALASVARLTPSSMQDLMSQVARYASILNVFTVYLFGCLLLSAYFFANEIPQRRGISAKEPTVTWRVILVSSAALLVVSIGVIFTNLRPIQADITFKLGEGFNQPGAWPAAIEIYNKANQLAPNEDYYYLYLGRAYLEQARSMTDTAEQDRFLGNAVVDLKRAQALNPLNTDHTANLARLYSLWAALSQDQAKRQERAAISDQYFSRAVVLSPNNVRLWNEWAYLSLSILGQLQEALPRLERAKDIDATYDWTFGQLGDIASRQADKTIDPTEKQTLLEEAIQYYRQALALPGEAQIKYNVGLSLGMALSKLGRVQEAISTYVQAIDAYPQSSNIWRIEEVIAQLYLQDGDLQQAQKYATFALAHAPQDQQERLKSYLDLLNSQR